MRRQSSIRFFWTTPEPVPSDNLRSLQINFVIVMQLELRLSYSVSSLKTRYLSNRSHPFSCLIPRPSSLLHPSPSTSSIFHRKPSFMGLISLKVHRLPSMFVPSTTSTPNIFKIALIHSPVLFPLADYPHHYIPHYHHPLCVPCHRKPFKLRSIVSHQRSSSLLPSTIPTPNYL
jgi:hypothetical protein